MTTLLAGDFWLATSRCGDRRIQTIMLSIEVLSASLCGDRRIAYCATRKQTEVTPQGGVKSMLSVTVGFGESISPRSGDGRLRGDTGTATPQLSPRPGMKGRCPRSADEW